MIVVEIAPEHVLHPVGRVEHAGAKALLRFFESVEQHALAIVVIGVTLREEGFIVEHLFVQGPCVFRETERCVRPEQFRQIDGVGHGMRDGQIGPAGIDVHRRDIDFDFGRKFLEIKAADSVSAEAHAGFELHGNPIRVFANLQREALGVHREAGVSSRFCRDESRRLTRSSPPAPPLKRILRAGDVGTAQRAGRARLERELRLREICRRWPEWCTNRTFPGCLSSQGHTCRRAERRGISPAGKLRARESRNRKCRPRRASARKAFRGAFL